jgi:hypothetical protein
VWKGLPLINAKASGRIKTIARNKMPGERLNASRGARNIPEVACLIF